MVIISHTKNLKSIILSMCHSAMKGVINIEKENPMLFQSISVGMVRSTFQTRSKQKIKSTQE